MHKALKVCFGCALLAVPTAAMAQSDDLSFYKQRLAAAQQHCGSDTVLWLNTKTGVISKPGTSDYGTTESGRYVCEHDQSKGRYGTEAEPTTLTPTTPPSPHR
jgi:hypothetical protein